MGTAFMATTECPIHENIKKTLVEGKETDTTHVFRTLGNTERVFKNRTSLEVRDIESKHPGEFDKIAHLVFGANYKRSFLETGDNSDSVWSCGQSIGLIEEILPCATLISNVVAEAEDIIGNLQTRLCKL